MPDVRYRQDTIVTDDNVVVASITVTINGEEFTSSYSAKTDPNDRFDEQVGLEIAIGRAMRSVGRRMHSSGQKKVHKADKAARSQKEASIKALEIKRKAAKKARRAALKEK